MAVYLGKEPVFLKQREDPSMTLGDLKAKEPRTMSLVARYNASAAIFVARKLLPQHFEGLLQRVAFSIDSTPKELPAYRVLKAVLFVIRSSRRGTTVVRVARAILKAVV